MVLPYHDTIDNMVDLYLVEKKMICGFLTIWRNGKFFEIFTRGPLGGIFEFTRPDESQMIMELVSRKGKWRKKRNIVYLKH